MKRRKFIQQTAALAAASMVATDLFASGEAVKSIGIQLFSVPKMLEQNFARGIAQLAEMGFTEIEMYGPFPFSADAAKKSWAQVTSQLGFSGSGFFGSSAEEVRAIFRKNNMRCPSIHTDYETLLNNMDGLAKGAETIGYEYVCLPAIPPDRRKTIDDYKRVAEDFNKIGENAKKHQLKFAYHNHGYGLKPVNGIVPFEMVIESTDPKLVFLEMDLFWTTAGGVDPVTYLKKYRGRYRMMHVKDMKEKKTFSGDGGDPAQWIELFPYMTTAGDGVLDLKAILSAARENGVEHFFVEQDMVANPEVALKRSVDYLKKIS